VPPLNFIRNEILFPIYIYNYTQINRSTNHFNSFQCILLTKNRAFGSKKHQNQVLGLYEDIQRAVAMALFHWSAQRGLPRSIAIRLLQQLAARKTNDADGLIDEALGAQVFGFFYRLLLEKDLVYK